jgi:hypothetical protein
MDEVTVEQHCISRFKVEVAPLEARIGEESFHSLPSPTKGMLSKEILMTTQ